MPRATENDLLPYETALEDRLARFQRHEAHNSRVRRVLGIGLGVASAIVWLMFFVLPKDPAYTSFLCYLAIALTCFTLATRPRTQERSQAVVNLMKLVFGLFLCALGSLLLLAMWTVFTHY
jgi:multisubunit Na+/H+ antiporter MnhB subunit